MSHIEHKYKYYAIGNLSKRVVSKIYTLDELESYSKDKIWYFAESLAENITTYRKRFTGYYDNNGEEIYEDDILSTPYYGDLQVIFSQHSGGWIFYPIDKNSVCSPSDRVINDLYHLNYSKDVDEIVDYFNRDKNSDYYIKCNIHQNPELMGCI